MKRIFKNDFENLGWIPGGLSDRLLGVCGLPGLISQTDIGRNDTTRSMVQNAAIAPMA